MTNPPPRQRQQQRQLEPAPPPIPNARYFPLSPTYTKWVKLSAADIHALRQVPGFEGLLSPSAISPSLALFSQTEEKGC